MKSDFTYVAKSVLVAVATKKGCGGFDIWLPDLDVTAHGYDFLDAFARANLTASAIKAYNDEHEVETKITHQFEDITLATKDKDSFVTVITIGN